MKENFSRTWNDAMAPTSIGGRQSPRPLRWSLAKTKLGAFRDLKRIRNLHHRPSSSPSHASVFSILASLGTSTALRHSRPRATQISVRDPNQGAAVRPIRRPPPRCTSGKSIILATQCSGIRDHQEGYGVRESDILRTARLKTRKAQIRSNWIGSQGKR